MNARLPLLMLLVVLPACGAKKAAADTSGAPHMRPAEQGASSAVYFTMKNPAAEPLVIYGVEIDVAAESSIHQSMDRNGLASMAMQDSVMIPANGSVAFAERGLHVMATNLHTALNAGDTVVVRLLIRPARVDTLRVPVRE